MVTDSKKRFFEPFKGKFYDKGIKGKKILVVGASLYCKGMIDDHHECQYFSECTSDGIKDCSKFDKICPSYVRKQDYFLHNEAIYSREYVKVRANVNFGKFLQNFIPQKENPWDYVAYTCYVQYILGHVTTYRSNITERDFVGLKETIIELKPDLIITWGVLVQDAIREWHKECIVDYEDRWSPTNEGWLNHLKIDNYEKTIPILFFWHPSSSKWYSDIDTAKRYFMKALNE